MSTIIQSMIKPLIVTLILLVKSIVPPGFEEHPISVEPIAKASIKRIIFFISKPPFFIIIESALFSYIKIKKVLYSECRGQIEMDNENV